MSDPFSNEPPKPKTPEEILADMRSVLSLDNWALLPHHHIEHMSPGTYLRLYGQEWPPISVARPEDGLLHWPVLRKIQ